MGEKMVFEGIKVVEFTGFAAGPVTAKHLADHGATVVRIESRTRPDGFRTHYPPFTDNKPGLNRSACFALCNENKYSAALNLRAPGAMDLAQRFIAWADIVIENFTPGTMKRLGLGYDELRQLKPDIIMVSTCNQGQTGPHASHPGFGSHLTSLSGFTHLIGYPDRTPVILYGPYIDYIGVGYGVIAICAALDYRRRTGKGQYIDLAQYENGLQFLVPVILDYQINGRIAQRMGNRSPDAAPHGAYPCLGEDRWCALSIHSDEEWQHLCQVMGRPELARDERFTTFLGRKQNEEELDRLIGEWTSQLEPKVVMTRLQEAGLAAGVVNTMADIFSDPQLEHRHVWWPLEHPEMGMTHYEGPPFALSETPAKLDRPAPCIGEHSRQVYTEFLSMSGEEYEELVSKGVIN
ncbi:MAG: CoA transferase [Chloroflexi bacterium]|nr:CoA transferase [Chloroflexota bacterium]